MTKKMDINIWTIGKRALIITSLLSVIGWFGTAALKEFAKFAKAEDMQKTTQVLDKLSAIVSLNASRNFVQDKKADVRWMRQQTMYEPRIQPLTDAEEIMIKEEESELAEVKSEYNDKVRRFKEKFDSEP